MTSTRMTKADKDAYRMVLAKHQKKHPDCKLNERVCKSQLAEDCIGKGDASEFHKTAATCKRCLVIVNQNYYLKTAEKRREERAQKAKV